VTSTRSTALSSPAGEDEAGGRVVGTYRMQTSEMARAGSAFTGRRVRPPTACPSTCSSVPSRSGAPVSPCPIATATFLPLVERARRVRSASPMRFLFGLLLLDDSGSAGGARAFADLCAAGHLHPALARGPPAGLECDVRRACSRAGEAPDPVPERTLRYGAKISAGPPRSTGIQDDRLLTILDLEAMASELRDGVLHKERA